MPNSLSGFSLDINRNLGSNRATQTRFWWARLFGVHFSVTTLRVIMKTTYTHIHTRLEYKLILSQEGESTIKITHKRRPTIHDDNDEK